MPLASIVIRTKNEERWLGRVLKAIAQQTWAEREVIVVDSGSTDTTLTIARHDSAKIVELAPRSFTYGRALNRGVQEAKGEFIVALSGHAVPASQTWLATLLAPLKDPIVGAVYGRCIPLPGCNPFDAKAIRCHFGTQRQIQTANHRFSNANGAWRKDVWEFEQFDERLPATEDQAWAAALLRRGFVIVYEPKAVVCHSHNRTPAQIFRTTQAEVAAMKWLDQSSEQWSVAKMLWLWARSTLGGWRTTWQYRSHWRWWLYCPTYYLAQQYGYYRGLRDPLFSTYPHAHPQDRPPVSA